MVRAFNRFCQGNKTPQKCAPPRTIRAAKLSLQRSRCRWSLVNMRFELVTLRRDKSDTRSSERRSSNWTVSISNPRKLLGSVDNFNGPVDSEAKRQGVKSYFAQTLGWFDDKDVIEICQHSIPSPCHHTTNRLCEAMKHHWWGPGSKWETLIIEVRHSCISPAVGVCANASVCMFYVNFC